jgi:hypothetical protein
VRSTFEYLLFLLVLGSPVLFFGSVFVWMCVTYEGSWR